MEVKNLELANHDLAPVVESQRTWNGLHFFSLWVGMVVCIPSYMIAASLVQGGMNWLQALLTVFLGNFIVLIPMLLNGHVGAKYGIPYPIFARASFGVRGANVPAFFRAIVACGWFGIQSWIGGAAIYTLLLLVWPGAASAPAVLPETLGVGLIPFICFLIFWGINIWLIWRGTDSIKVLETWAAPFLIASGLALLVWAYQRADGFGPMLSSPSKFESSTDFWNFFFPALTGMVGYWATLSLNISDFTRYARSQRAQVWGQALGLPTTMTLFAFIGIAVTSATVVIFGEPLWDPLKIIQKFDQPLVVAICTVAIIIATLSTNVAANVVGPANDFSSFWPKHIDFKRGGYITGVIGIIMMPWKLIADPTGYIFTWLIGYSALLGPIAGILMVDYFLVRGMNLKVQDLYRRGGAYEYQNGFNPKAMLALVLGVLPNILGFMLQVGLVSAETVGSETAQSFTEVYHYAWFTGLFVSGVSYLFLMRGAVYAGAKRAYHEGV